MKKILLTDDQYKLLIALINSDLMDSDAAGDFFGEACSHILYGSTNDDPTDEQMEDEFKLQNDLFDALGNAEDVADE